MEKKEMVPFRLPVSLREELKREAEENHRSMVSIIVEMLMKRYKSRKK